MKISKILMGSMVSMAAVALMAHGATDNVAEEVVWMIGDQPIWKSEVEEAYQQMQQERHNLSLIHISEPTRQYS